jgi:hypothetical protein
MQIKKTVIRSLAACTAVFFLLTAALALLALATPSPAWAVTQTEIQKLLASDGAQWDGFGNSVAVDGDTAVIGASGDDDNGEASGSAYVFSRSAGGVWSEQQKLTASDAAEEDHFGHSVAVDGDTAVIGALGDDDDGEASGSAYVFTRSAGGVWSEQQKLTATDAAVDDNFGFSVAVDEDTAVIGAYADDEGSGAAYVFSRSAGGVWSEQQKLTASDGGDGESEQFGWSVAVDGGIAVIGAAWDYDDNDNGYFFGSAYVFSRSAGGVWSEQQKLTASDGAEEDHFGWSVAVNGDTAVIGAWGDDDDGSRSGSAYVFSHNTVGVWSEQQKLTASDAAAVDLFGWSVAVDGDTAVIGAWGDSTAYVFSHRSDDVWTEQQKLTASDGEDSDFFGGSVAMDADTAVIGARADYDNGLDSGSAYVFALKRKVDIDIKPYNRRNPIYPYSRGGIWVAILSDREFDPLQVKIRSVRFGRDKAKAIRHRVRDINRDGVADLMLRFKIRKAGIRCGDTKARLKAKTYFGERVVGSDSIKTVGCKCGKCHGKKHCEQHYGK